MNLDRTQAARELYDRAAAALDAAQLGEANAMIRLAIRENPDDPAARLLDAHIQLRRNLPEFAIVALDTRDQLDPAGAQDPAIALVRAEALAAAAFDDLAEKLLRDLVAVVPHDPRPHRMLAGIYMKDGRGELAAAHLRQVRELDPRDESARRLLAHVLAPTSPRAAADAAMKASDSPAADAADLLRSARLCRHSDRLRDAADLYTQLLKAQPHDAALWLEAGELAAELGETDLAVKRLQEAATLDRRHRAAALDALARVHMRCGRFAAAAAVWWKLARGAAGEPRPWAGLWLCAWSAGRSTLARRVRRRLEACSDATRRCAVLAELWPDVAAHRAQDALSRQAAGGSVLAELAQASATTLDRAAAHWPDRADVHFHRAVCAHLLGDTPRTRDALQRALAINPNYVAARHLLDLAG